MKKILIFFIILLQFSCGQNQISKEDNNGEVIFDTIGNVEVDRNLKFQIQEYLVAFNGGDPDKALYYVYSDIFEYLKQQYPDEEIDMQQIKDSLFIEPIRQMKTHFLLNQLDR